MPELPEVETMKRGIASVIGRQIVSVDRPPCRLKPIEVAPSLATFRRRALGRTIVGLDRVGKRVVVILDSHDRIILEPRMTGLVLVAEPPNLEHLRLVIGLAGSNGAKEKKTRLAAQELLYWDRRGLGSVRLLTPAEFDERYGLERVGPDALKISSETLRERLAASRREIKVGLLDQRAVAGIGNLYASEILHLARINPERRCDRLRVEEWSTLHAAVVEILETAIRFEGSTLSDGTYRNALNEAGGYQNHHRVYDRAKAGCFTCSTPIVRLVQAQRSTFFCPTCQPKRAQKRTPAAKRV
jgi:formamidopyrimidine-DNA glycosylase